MRFTEHYVEQGTPEWHALRLGKLTSSTAADMLAEIKTGEAAARRNLRVKLVLERITGAIEESGWTSSPMRRGTELEPVALAAYEALTGAMVERVGFVTLSGVEAGASPDGRVDGGLVEVKCPLAATHLGYLKSGKIPGNYYAQILHLLWITGADCCDWMSFHPNFPEPLQSKLIRVPYVTAEISEYEAKALEFLGEVAVEETLVREMSYGEAA